MLAADAVGMKWKTCCRCFAVHAHLVQSVAGCDYNHSLPGPLTGIVASPLYTLETNTCTGQVLLDHLYIK